MMSRIYPTIITTERDHLKRLRETEDLGIKEVCFFATGIDQEQRKVFYQELEKTSIKKIPFVHLRSDMEVWELDFLVEKYGTEVLNCHSPSEYPLRNDLSSYAHMIYIENTSPPLKAEEVEVYAGVCLDISRLESDRRTRKNVYENNLKIIKKYPVGCGHISAIKKESHTDPQSGIERFDAHDLQDVSELNYLNEYRQYLPPIMALELENSLDEQQRILDYLKSIGI